MENLRSSTAGKIAGLAAACGLALSLAVHLYALAGIDVQEYIPGIWWLHAGMFPPMLLAIIAMKAASAPQTSRTGLLKALPWWGTLLLLGLLVYGILDYVLVLGQHMGSPEARDGRFFLTFNRNKIVQEISEAGYHESRAYLIRAFSHFWLLAYSLPAVYFLARPRALAVRKTG